MRVLRDAVDSRERPATTLNQLHIKENVMKLWQAKYSTEEKPNQLVWDSSESGVRSKVQAVRKTTKVVSASFNTVEIDPTRGGIVEFLNTHATAT